MLENVIKFDNIDLAICSSLGLQRHMRKVQDGHNSGERMNINLSWQECVAEEAESIAAEWSVARYFNIEFDTDTINDNYKNKADVGNGLEVKWTKYTDGHMIIHEWDRPSDIAVLVVGRSPVFTIKGWIPVSVARKPRYKHVSQPKWWVGQMDLQPIETLKWSNYANAIN